MESGFEKYIKQNKAEFEKDAPSPKVWQQLQARLVAQHQKKARIIKMRRISLRIAAGLLFFVGIWVLFFKIAKQPGKAVNTGIAVSPKQPAVGTVPGKVNADSLKIAKQQSIIAQAGDVKKDRTFELTGTEYGQSINYYTRLVENEQKQVQQLRVIDPDIYKESQNAIDGLNTIYDQLKSQLHGSIDQQKVIELMIKNLQMQERVLKNQLQLIREMQLNNQGKNEKSVKEI
jgi:hypothetical protein